MQYILTEEEYIKLKVKRQQLNNQELENIQQACTLACDNTPIYFWGRKIASPWRCILTVMKKNEENGTQDKWYCDKCLVQDACPYKHKEWSK